ncbi:uncharacterized protein LAESUDRAFT_69293 [Laetiporus sulphureus 93-53]|uniref:Uncharacterized protein n=1 Tax=Laetiporus sulphureus 93-53 TaxID=1314785 RepID=A0A165F6Z3_9APHY|nr:uncharacterized protein LAESUDRAFT_69293 [Laetiporus sulphureus 93-53]KZT08507.1 hypothetical protein LAESUDRAFT_69293 [Laetiporus sulphureus 93-53]
MNYNGVYTDAAYHRSKHSHSHHRHRHHSSTNAMPQTIPFRRSHTADTYSHPNPWTPWDDMAQTLSRVLEEDMAAMACQTEDMFRRALQQQEHYFRSDNTFRATFDTSSLSSLFFGDDHHQAYKEAWRIDAQRLREQEDAMREQLRRLQQARLETERCRAAYERQKAEDAAREQRRRKRENARRDEADKKAWQQAYEAKWADITSTSATPAELTFRAIPWPMFSEPQSVEEITPSAVKAFVLSPLHSEGQSRKERIKSALKRWHPDRFGRVLVRVVECDKASVEEGVGIVVRCLNGLLENETGRSS